MRQKYCRYCVFECCRMRKSFLEHRFRGLNCFEARPSLRTSSCRSRPSSHSERNVGKASQCSVSKCCRIRRSLLEQRFRALIGFEARPISDFERPVSTEHARAATSSVLWENTALVGRFRMLPNNFTFTNFRLERSICYVIYGGVQEFVLPPQY